MGVSLNHGGGQQKGMRRQRPRPMSDINITPMVDVMLVLLIVFMVTAPLLTVGVPVDLPQVQAKTLESKTEPVVVTLNKSGQLFLKDNETTIDALVRQLVILQKDKPDTRVYVRGDKDISYGAVMVVMGKLNAAGIAKVALVSELPKGKPLTETSALPLTP